MKIIRKLSRFKGIAKGIFFVLWIVLSNLFLQWCQNDRSLSLALHFAFSWHTAKFFLSCLVLAVAALFILAVTASFWRSFVLYTIGILGLGIATYLKMKYRQEPLYPDDLKMIFSFELFKEILGPMMFLLYLAMLALFAIFLLWSVYQSFFLSRKRQLVRLALLAVMTAALGYIYHFNQKGNLLHKAYDESALWIPYSQQMNYYNVGFVAGFLYNLNVEPMKEPVGYSKAAVEKITAKYQKEAQKASSQASEAPNIVFVMSESFSDMKALQGITVEGDPLADYRMIADKTYSGQMLSQNYGGGTANIEFEALTGFSMEPYNAQLTTPYTMLVPKKKSFPSVVELLKQQGYDATAIHPYNTSMYKRKDVYQVFGFDQFWDEEHFKHPVYLGNNPFIPDKAAYAAIQKKLKNADAPQFMHLVTMQTHMPYEGKYDTLDYPVDGSGKNALENYAQDVANASTALKDFINGLSNVKRRTLVVFWGDHLPGIYSNAIQKENPLHTLHLTPFLMYDSAGKLSAAADHEAVLSPVYFAPELFKQSGLPLNGFYQLLMDLHTELPAFEKQLYYENGQWEKEMKLSENAEAIYKEYCMIQYDVSAGKQYAIQTDFFDGEAK